MDKSYKRDLKKKPILKHWIVAAFFLFVYDVIAINFSYFFALLLRFDFTYSLVPRSTLIMFLKFAPVQTALTVGIYFWFRLYNSIWKFASVNELSRIFVATTISTFCQAVMMSLFMEQMSLVYCIVGAVLQFVLVTAVRFSYRYIVLLRAQKTRVRAAKNNVMIIGAGTAGQLVIKELHGADRLESRVMCLIDDNPNKWGRIIGGVPIVGGRDKILESVKKYDITQILFAIPAATPQQKKEILNICKESGCKLKSLPGIYQIASGEILVSKMRPVEVEDLLGRDQIKVSMDEITGFLKDKVVLVTGGGGSIGSELCRQIASSDPKQLIIFDIYENNAYEIQQELKRKYGKDLNLEVLIGSVRDAVRLDQIFNKYRPDIVYHAAAHKHVPLMETSPNEAIKNNVIGTYKTAYFALKYKVKRFVLISTDKAVNPTNIMGASKRLCEMVVQSMDRVSKSGKLDMLPVFSMQDIGISENSEDQDTQFVAVRFGNVLGSNGSVIPLFKKQLEAGGPITVTHPDVVRYFMTIQEAVSLVLQAGVYASGGEIFVLDMGDPVKIDTLARNLIQLSGYEVGRDINIVYTGLRPGEKLFEEKLMAEEGLQRTDNKLIHIGKPIPFNIEIFLKQLEDLVLASYSNSRNIVSKVANIVTTFKPENLEIVDEKGPPSYISNKQSVVSFVD